MIIRRAENKDITPLMQLVKMVVPLMNASGNLQWDDTYPNPEVFEQDIRLGQLWVAELEHTVAGVAAITTDQDEEYAQVGWDLEQKAIVIHRLAVHPHFHGQGVAVALMQQAEVVAEQEGADILRVDTNSMNTATQKLFPKLRYVFSGELNLHRRPGLVFYAYEKRIKGGSVPDDERSLNRA